MIFFRNNLLQYVLVHVLGSQKLSFAGDSSAPAASAVLQSIGGVGTSKANNDIAGVLHPLVEKLFGVPQSRHDLFSLFKDFVRA